MKKILIADDHQRIRELVRVTLSDIDDYQITEAGTSSETLALAQGEMPDLILLDVMFPSGMDGIDVARILKADSKTKHIKIICLTARGEKTDKNRGYLAGVDDYLVKPFNPSELIAKVESILED